MIEDIEKRMIEIQEELEEEISDPKIPGHKSPFRKIEKGNYEMSDILELKSILLDEFKFPLEYKLSKEELEHILAQMRFDKLCSMLNNVIFRNGRAEYLDEIGKRVFVKDMMEEYNYNPYCSSLEFNKFKDFIINKTKESK